MPYTVDRPDDQGLLWRSYIPGIVRALALAAKGALSRRKPAQDVPPGARTEHRLMLRADGSIRCTACMLCVAACPSQCIRVEVDESVPPEGERRPRSFEIDLLACTFCGACVEACPCDAIRMDTGRLPPAACAREELVYDMARLAANHPEGASPLSRAL